MVPEISTLQVGYSFRITTMTVDYFTPGLEILLAVPGDGVNRGEAGLRSVVADEQSVGIVDVSAHC